VDIPLGGLAKWLRFCGFDTLSRDLRAPDPESLPPPEGGTFLVTGQLSLASLKRPDILIIYNTTPEGQLHEIFHRLGVNVDHLDPLSRCVRCNEILTEIPRQLAAGRLPDYIWHTQAEFYECPRCRRLYWPGSHFQHIMEKLKQITPD